MPVVEHLPTPALRALWWLDKDLRPIVLRELQTRAERALVGPGGDPEDEDCDVLMPEPCALREVNGAPILGVSSL
jgi:hypothetical protein